MSCKAGLPDNRGNKQTTDNPRAQAGAPHKTAFRELKNDIETANAILKAAIEDAVESLDYVEFLFADAEPDPSNTERVSLDWQSFDTLKKLRDNAVNDIERAFRDCDWELRRAMRAFKEAVVRETAP